MSVKAILENYAQQKYFTHASYGEESFLSNKTKIISYSAQQNALEYIYDIASLTKVFATGVMLVAGMEELQVKLTTPLSDFKCFQKDWNINAHDLQAITIGDLLSHTSGLSPWFPFYVLKNRQDSALWPLFFKKAQKDGQRRYSDLGFLCLGKALEELWQMKISDWFEKNIIKKLQLKNTGFRHQLADISNDHFVPTSLGNPYEKFLTQKTLQDWNTDLEKFHIECQKIEDVFFRNYRLQGECNDANCFLWNQSASHAGLFSDAKELSQIIRYCFMDNDSYAKRFKELVQLSSEQKQYLFCTSFSTLQWSEDIPMFGHHGFTGCSFSIDKDFSHFRIFLSNRQYYGMDPSYNYPQWKKILPLLSSEI